MSIVRTYNPEEVAILVNGVPIQGSGTDTFVTISYNETDFTRIDGAKGAVARARNLNDGGTITINLLQTDREDIQYLESLAKIDRATGLGVVSIAVTDLRSGEAVVSRQSWLEQRPDREFGAEVGEREYVYQCAKIEDVG